MNGPPAVSVIVPVHGDRGEVGHTLSALVDQDYEGPVQIVLIDNGECEALDATIAAAGARVTLVAEATPGSYAARNTGLGHADGEILAFTDADCLPTHSWLSRGVAAVVQRENPCFAGGGIEIALSDNGSPPLGEAWDVVHGLNQSMYVNQQGWAATANMFVRRDVFERVGPFDATLKSGGDRAWGTRASAAGVEATYAPDALIHHPARALPELQTKIVRVTWGLGQANRLAGNPVYPASRLLRSLIPSARSTLRLSRTLRRRGLSRRVQTGYVVTAIWLQYYRLAVELRVKWALRRRPS